MLVWKDIDPSVRGERDIPSFMSSIASHVDTIH